ncbi:hypothetical protein GE107_08015 [Cohnella sp. CFH 77786]|uniref:hypothetical protein n=1 Tax=Cohnella sp. CFH 77786 TaxID=2662265 RepID=UPI001C60EAD9|nr:hypothetical protein [Cohnella sp. CFH 77786]MBW5446004.1 hypothetical protein [Cohnella sp. CFH 77786]
MTLSKINRSGILFLCITALILAVDSAAARMTPFGESDAVLAYAVLFDFALVIPFLYWLLGARRNGKSIVKMIPFTIAGAAAAWLVLPDGLRGRVWSAVWPVELTILAIELAVVGYEIRVVYRLIRAYRHSARKENDFGEALRSAMRSEFGPSKLKSFVLHDICVIHYLLFSWKRRVSEAAADGSLFTYHRKTSQLLYAGILTHVVAFEAVFVHLLVQQWSHFAAWILTAADVWLLALVWADCRASLLRPVRIMDGVLRIRLGLRLQADVPLDAIGGIASAPEYEPEAKELKHFACPILGAPNVRIELNRPLTVEGLLFQPREVTGIYLALDDPQGFVQSIVQARG